ncbi:MAG TPA: hypothetical protein VF463_15040 [Sphingobium sp.]
MPPAPQIEIIEVLQSLEKSWPSFESVTWAARAGTAFDEELVKRYLAALQWLTDMGLITFEAMSIGPSSLSVRQAALTSRGRDYVHSSLPSMVDPKN